MTTRGERLVHVAWEGPFTPQEVLALTGPEHHGIYQTIGVHLVFGPNSLLYIGSTFDQTFARRFKQHLADGLEHESEILVRVGTIVASDRPKSRDEYSTLVSEVEALTIYWHSPPYNSQYIRTHNVECLRVHNLGKRGVLHPEYSTQWAPLWRPVDKEVGAADK